MAKTAAQKAAEAKAAAETTPAETPQPAPAQESASAKGAAPQDVPDTASPATSPDAGNYTAPAEVKPADKLPEATAPGLDALNQSGPRAVDVVPDAALPGTAEHYDPLHEGLRNTPLPEAVVLKATDRIGKTHFRQAGEDTVEFKGDVLEEFYYPDTKRPSHRILFTKGQIVKQSEVDALNVLVDQARELAKN